MVGAVGFLAWSAFAIMALGPVAYAMPGAIIVAWAAGHPQALAWRPLTGSGRISYGLYLYHYPLIGLAVAPVLLVGATYALAWRILAPRRATVPRESWESRRRSEQ